MIQVRKVEEDRTKKMSHNAVQHRSTQQHSTAQHSTAQHSTPRHMITAEYSTAPQHITAQRSTAYHIAPQFSIVKYSIAQHSTATVQHSTAHHLISASFTHSLPSEMHPYSNIREAAWVRAITMVRLGVPCVLTGGEKLPSRKDLMG